MNEVIEKLLKQLFEKTGKKHDAYYYEGYHVSFVPEGMPESNTFLVVQEFQLQMMKQTGQELIINVR